jgi:hypothetical protein
MATNTYVALDKITVSGSSTNTVTLSAIPQTYKDLVIVCSGTQAALTDMAIRFNGDTAGNYSKTLFSGNGSTPVTAPYTNASQIFVTYQSTSQANTIIHIMNYADTSVQKTVLAQGSATGTAVQLNSGAWRKSPLEAINSITIFPFGGTNFSDGYTVSLYGIAAEATSPALKASGGTVYADDLYYYHVFGSTGVFTPNQTISGQYLVVAGGGGGGGNNTACGGGGGGGYRSAMTGQLSGANSSPETAVSLVSGTNYTVTIGGGGTAGVAISAGGNGTASSIIGGAVSISSTGGGGGGAGNGVSGGSGGGGSGQNSNGTTGAAGTSLQGFAGGNGLQTGVNYSSAGGGGAGAVGSNGINQIGGNGGAGITANLYGVVTFGGGGGGGNSNDAAGPQSIAGGLGGIGGGGAGGRGSNTTGQAGFSGMANTGGGGGGGASHTGTQVYNGGAGGSGIVMIRYLKA